MEVHNRLTELYASKWEGFGKALQEVVEEEGVKPAYPFLLSLAKWEGDKVSEDWYSSADLKVMVFGQETNSWCGKVDDFGTPPSPVFDREVSMDAVMGIYEEFYASHYEYEGGRFKYNGRRYGTFHHGVNGFAQLLQARYPGKNIAYVWNNVVKVGKAEGRGFCGERIRAVEREFFPVVREEVELLRPDVLLFLTGSYDERIREDFGGAEFTPLAGFEVQEVARVALPGIAVPAFRTCHPSARIGKEVKERYYQAIVEGI